MTNCCERCDRPIVRIGSARKNGRGINDWKSRRLHTKCWREIQRNCERKCKECSVWKVGRCYEKIGDEVCRQCKIINVTMIMSLMNYEEV